jgi:CRISPR/Cas system-associated exonuclease Cas4 (RecB family)
MEKFSEPFLEKVATRILQDFPDGMQHACVVMPNRRAAIFLKRFMGAAIEKPVFAPSIFSIEDFVFELSGLNPADQLVLLWELYACYSKSGRTDTQSFEEFLKWGKVLLQDFEDIDMHLVDAQDLFGYLSEAKAIELWNPAQHFLTAGQQRYLAFYRSLGDLHATFKDRLLELRIAYKGLAFRRLTEAIVEKFSGLQWDHFYFVGFNALTPSELKIIDSLSEVRKVTRMYDADSYYLDDPKQEAGKYLREIARHSKSGKLEWIENKLLKDAKNITVIGVPHNTGQVLAAGSLLADLDPAEAGDTAVVLNDESLLIPLLNSMPDNIGHFNVTMGYPFSLTPVYGLMDTLFNLHLHAFDRTRKTEIKDDERSNLRFYFRNVAGLLKHPYVFSILRENENKKPDPVLALLNEGKVFFSTDEIFHHFEGDTKATAFLELAFGDWAKAPQAIEKLLQINRMLAASMSANDDAGQHKMDLEYLYQFYLILNRLKLLTTRAGGELSLRGLQQLIKNVASGTQLPFVGEPLKGVQIMGMLETRALDFKNVIMLSVNEGVLPAGKHGNSFVPFDIRKDFKLPVYSDRDAVFAYHFYRLLQRCQNMYLVYNTTPDEMGGGEKSRFVLQIEHELKEANKSINYNELFYTPPVRFDQAVKEISVDKTPGILARLAEMAQHGLSPTALSTYVVCPLKFYFTYVLKISEENTVEDTMDASTFGTGIHDALQDLFEPYINKALTPEILDTIAKNANQALHENFLKAYNNNDLSYGKNLLMVKVAESFLRRFFRLEKEHVEALQNQGEVMTVTALEYSFADTKPIEVQISFSGNSNFPVRLRGKADRIDKIGGRVRVVDYKTGTVKAKDLKLEEWEQLLSEPDKGKSLQLLMYAWLYAKEFNSPLPESGIISFRHLKEDFMGVAFPGDPNAAIPEIENVLQQLVQNIFDDSIPFDQTDDVKNCVYCPFAGICNR